VRTGLKDTVHPHTIIASVPVVQLLATPSFSHHFATLSYP
jgi:hypothetical protein